MKRLLTILLMGVLLLTITACGNDKKSLEKDTDQEKNTDEILGSWNGNTYTNNYFGFKLTTPEEWYTLSQEEQLAVMKAGLEQLGQSTENIDFTELNVLALLSTFERDITTPSDAYNPSITINAEKLVGLNADLTPESYLNTVTNGLKQSGMDYVFSDIQTTTLGGREFTAMNSTVEYQGFNIKMSFFCTKVDSYILNIIVGFTEDTEQPVTDVLNSIEFMN